MKWYSSTWNRFRKAYDGRYYDKNVEQRVQKIQGLVKRVGDELKLSTARSVNIMHSGHQRSLLEFRSEFRSRFDHLEEKLLALAETWGPYAPFRELAPALALQLVSNSEQGKRDLHNHCNHDVELTRAYSTY